MVLRQAFLLQRAGAREHGTAVCWRGKQPHTAAPITRACTKLLAGWRDSRIAERLEMATTAQGVILESSGFPGGDFYSDSASHQSRIVFPILMAWEVDTAVRLLSLVRARSWRGRRQFRHLRTALGPVSESQLRLELGSRRYLSISDALAQGH